MTTVTGTFSFTPPAPATAAQVAAALAATPSFVAAVAAALAPPVVVPPVVVPPVVVPPTVGLVYADGVFHWGGDFNYGGAVANYQATDPVSGGKCLQMTSTPTNSTPPTMGAGGGWLPWYKAGVAFPLAGFNFLNLSLLATRAGQAWSIPPAEGVNDSGISGIQVDPTKYAVNGSLVLNQWLVCKIKLSDMGLTQTSPLAKFGVQDQMPWGSHPENAPNNVYYINNVYFSAT